MATDTFLTPASARRAGVTETAARGTRLLYLDNVRVALITMVVVGHISITYGAPGEWFYHEVTETSPAIFVPFILLLGVGASFLLGLFFMIAAFLTPPAYDRKGARRFLVDRLLRLGIPLVFFAVVFNPLNECVVGVHNEPGTSFWACVPHHLPNMNGSGVSVMWFVELLLIFSLLYTAWRMISPVLGLNRARIPASQSLIPGNRAIALFALALTLASFVVRLWAPTNWWWEPPHLEPAHLPQYAFAFVAGLLAYRDGWFEGLLDTRARTWRWVALVGVLTMPLLAVAAGALSGELNPEGAGGLNLLSFAYCVWEAFTGVAMTITVLAWMRARFNHQGPLIGAMARSSYAVYFLHPPIVVLFTLALSGIRLDPGLKLLVVAPLGVALCYLIAAAVRRAPGMARVL